MGVAFSQCGKIAEINNLNAERSLDPSSPGSFFSLTVMAGKMWKRKLLISKRQKGEVWGDVGGRERWKKDETRTGRG